MGMFDHITFEYPFPESEFQADRFQTKDLDCTLAHYQINAEGQLTHLHGHWEDEPPLSKDVYFAFQLSSEQHEAYKRYWEEHTHWVAEPPTLLDDMHGDIYISASRGTGADWKYYQWVVRFTHGKVESIKRVEDN